MTGVAAFKAIALAPAAHLSAAARRRDGAPASRTAIASDYDRKHDAIAAAVARRLFCFNWILIGLVAVTLVLGLGLTAFSIRLDNAPVLLGAAALGAGLAGRGAFRVRHQPNRWLFALGSTGQIVLTILLFMPLTYVAAAAALPLMDGPLNDFDRALGLDWRGYFSVVYGHPALINAVVVFYDMIAIQIFAVPIVLGATRHHRGLQEFTLAYGLALIVTTVISVFMPAIGTYHYLGVDPDPAIFNPAPHLTFLRDFPRVRDGSLRVLDWATATGIITFPSFHTASAVLYVWAFWRVWWMRPVALIVNGGMLLATPILGGHYFVDILAGVAVAVVAIAAARHIGARLSSPREPASAPAPDTAGWPLRAQGLRTVHPLARPYPTEVAP